MKIRYNLKKERLKKQLTQKELAKLLNVSTSHYQAIELGARQGSIRIWDKLEDLFCISQRQLRETNKSEYLSKNKTR